MTAPVRVPAKLFLRALSCLEHLELPIAVELRGCLPRPSEKKRNNRKRNAAAKGAARAEKNTETSEIREAVFARAAGRCEFCNLRTPTEMHHHFGRKRQPQSVFNCVAICGRCHRRITDNEPSKVAVIAEFVRWASARLYLADTDFARAGYSRAVVDADADLEWAKAKAGATDV